MEDDEIFVFRVGPRELLIDGDESYLAVGGGIPVVYKADGRLEWLPGNYLYTSHPKLRRTRNKQSTVDA